MILTLTSLIIILILTLYQIEYLSHDSKMFDKTSYFKLRIISVTSVIILLVTIITLQYMALDGSNRNAILASSIFIMFLMSLIILCELNIIWYFELNPNNIIDV
jgi:L-asparagine transporter-like permease